MENDRQALHLQPVPVLGEHLSTWSAVGSRTPRTGELRSSPSILFFATAPDFATLLLQLGNGLGWVGSVGLGFYCSGLHMEPSELLFSGVFFADFFNGVFGRGVEIFFSAAARHGFALHPQLPDRYAIVLERSKEK